MSRICLDLPHPPGLMIGPAVLSPAQWAEVERMQTLIEALQGLRDQADAQVDAARREARERGTSEAVAEATARIADHIAAINRSHEQWVADSENRIAELACNIVEHLLPRLETSELMPVLVHDAVAAAQAERFLLIRVPEGSRALVESELPALRQLHPGVGDVEVIEDPLQDADTCVVISEAGEVRANLSERLDLVRRALSLPAQAGVDP